MTYHPKDHVRKSVRDEDRAKAQEAVDHLKALYRHANRTSNALITLTTRQPKGGLTRAEAAVLARMVLANLRASARGELHYRPGRAILARDTGYSERTVSKALSRLKEMSLIEAARYAKGGRVKSHGLATEWRSGGLDKLLSVLSSLGYQLGKGIADTITEAVSWARSKLTKRHENKQENSVPTGKLVPGTLVCKPYAAPGMAIVLRVAPDPFALRSDSRSGCGANRQRHDETPSSGRVRLLARRAAQAIRTRQNFPDFVPVLPVFGRKQL